MKKVLEFLNRVGVFYLATAEGDQPRVRPIGFVMESGGRLAFCTGNAKPMFRQLAANPKVEICCYDGQGNTLRVCGKAVFVTSEETQKKALEIMPTLSDMYSVGDGVFEIYCLDNARAVRSSMGGGTEEWTL